MARLSRVLLDIGSPFGSPLRGYLVFRVVSLIARLSLPRTLTAESAHFLRPGRHIVSTVAASALTTCDAHKRHEPRIFCFVAAMPICLASYFCHGTKSSQIQVN